MIVVTERSEQIMSKQNVKIPTKEGLEEARKKLKALRKKEPSPRLVKIIEEVTSGKGV